MKKKERSQTNNLTLNLKELEAQSQQKEGNNKEQRRKFNKKALDITLKNSTPPDSIIENKWTNSWKHTAY